MFHQVDTVFNATSSKPIPGAHVQVYDSSGAIVALFADESGTPIESVSGIANTSVTDDDGVYDFWIADGTYDLRFFVGQSMVRSIQKIALDGSAATAVTTKANASALGVLATESNLGAFSGSTIPPDQTAKQALQALETAVEERAQLTDLASPAPSKGASLVGTAGGGTVQGAVNAIEPSVWRRTPVADAALKFPDYAAALAFLGGTFVYPQGFSFDEDGNIYLNSASDSGAATHSAIVVYDSGFNYLRHFFRPTVGSESIVVTGSSGAGTLKLYFVVGTNLIEYAPGTWPANGAVLAAATNRITGGCGSIFNFNEGKWLVLQGTVDLGTISSRTAWSFYDTDFNPISRFFVAKNVVGWQTSASSGYPYVPKMQGITHRDGKIYIGTGGSYIPASEPSGPLRAADYGIVEVSADGSVLQYGVCAADLVLSKVAALGYAIERTECEGVAVGPDGALYTLLVTQRPSSVDAGTAGLVLMREMDILGERWDDIPSPYKPADLSRYDGKIWPRSSDNAMRDPVSNAAITTIAELTDLMLDMQLQHVAYFSAVHALAPLTGLPDLSESYRVDLYNLNNATIHCRLISTTTLTEQWFRFGGSPLSATRLSQMTSALYLADAIAAPATRAGYASIYVDAADGDLKVKFGDGTVKTIVVDS